MNLTATFRLSLFALCLWMMTPSSALLARSNLGDLAKSFITPPESARPGVYWYFMDGNQDRNEMVADLESMAKVGIGTVLILEVDIGVPRGPVPFMSEQWQDNFINAVKTAERLGMEVILGTGPGWAGSGGAWVRPEDSMQHLVGSTLDVTGPKRLDQKLDVPAPHNPNRFSGMNESHKAIRDAWYQDVAVLAFPTPEQIIARLGDDEIKTLKDVRPYSIDRTAPPLVVPRADYQEPVPGSVIDSAKVIDLTSRLQPGGRLEWDVPAGKWTVMRFVSRSTGQTTRPAPLSGHGFECDKFNGDAYRRHWANFQAKLLKKLGPLKKGKGLTHIHLDSWEMSSQNWTASFRQEFQRRRGYDPQPFYPAFMGLVLGSVEKTERFLWDMRKTAQELVLEQHAEVIKKIAHQHGLAYSNEPYDMNPAGNIDLGSVADVPACEFWNVRGGPDTQYSCIEAVSIAHTRGQQRVNAEAFTSDVNAFADFPASMKNQTDWAFAIGINGLIFHTFQHQAFGEKEKPGMTMGPYGVHWHRNETWWHLLPGYHQYITRCSHLLRQGEAVADILYLTPEGAPLIFLPPKSALQGPERLLDKRGFAFDAVTPRLLTLRAKVQNGRIAFPEGSSYSVLVLPDLETMTPETLTKVAALVQAGASVIGNPARKSPSLVGYPECDRKVAALARKVWGASKHPEQVQRISYGKGSIYWGGTLGAVNPQDSNLYPSYDETAKILRRLGIREDFSSPADNLRFIHRQTKEADIYFIANRTGKTVVTEGIFRVEGSRPQLWDPVTGTIRELPEFTSNDGATSTPLVFEPFQSFFVVFPRNVKSANLPKIAGANFARLTHLQTVDGPWDVSFDAKWGGPENIQFPELLDWSKHGQSGIRYYSGTAIYRKNFDLPADKLDGNSRLFLDLGAVHDICRVRLNGTDLGVVWTAPWRVDITSAATRARNKLEVEVVNCWVNRLIGDQQPADKNARTVSWPSGLLEGKTFKTGRHTFATHDYYQAKSPLMNSGLLGPVTLQVARP